MSVLKVILCVLIFTVSILRILFSVMGVRLGRYRILFGLTHILTVVISVIRIVQYVDLHIKGRLSLGDFETLFVLEIGTYFLSLLSVAAYSIKQNVVKMTGDMYDKCEVCNGDLYAHGTPDIIKNHHICGACIQTINEAKQKR
ncbi:MAG: hypothetical protein OEW48_04930 [Phycisphaerae bacterium]|nr:hypothetical protein [Phycisphaerae bacterium]